MNCKDWVNLEPTSCRTQALSPKTAAGVPGGFAVTHMTSQTLCFCISKMGHGSASSAGPGWLGVLPATSLLFPFSLS